MSRVVITGMGMYSPLGSSAGECMDNLKTLKNRVEVMELLGEYSGMLCHVAACFVMWRLR